MKKIFCVAVLLGLFLAATPVLAQDHSGENGHGGGSIDVLFRWFNFALLFGGLGYLLRRPLIAFFKSRNEEIQGGLRKAEEAQAESENNLAYIEDRLARLDEEISEIQAKGSALASSERERIVVTGKLEVNRAMQQARAEIERLTKTFEREIRAHVADLIIQGASKRLEANIDKDRHGPLATRFIGDIKL